MIQLHWAFDIFKNRAAKCPSCNRQFKVADRKCPHCRYEISEDEYQTLNKKILKEYKTSSLFGLGIFISLFIIFFIYFD